MCSVIPPLTVQAPAKLNLFLDVFGKRPDGYHELTAINLTVGWNDTITWKFHAGESLTLDVIGGDAPADETNLLWRATEIMIAGTGLGAHITLWKQLPTAAGLGGGSADAGAALTALNQHLQRGFSPHQILTHAADLGSDVPFACVGGCAVVKGRGELVTPLPWLPAPLWFVIVSPPVQAATGHWFSQLPPSEHRPHPAPDSLITALKQGETQQIARRLFNAFELVVLEAEPAIAQARQAVVNAGAFAGLLTGTGSNVFGLTNGAAHAETIARALELNYGPRVHIAPAVQMETGIFRLLNTSS